MNLAQQRDFYKLQPLTKEDVGYITAMISVLRDPVVRQHNMKLLGLFERASAAAFLAPPPGVDPQKLEEAQAQLLHNFDEDLHGLLEKREDPHLEDLLSGDGRGLSTRRIEFMHFVAGQHMRTKGIHDSVLLNLAPSMAKLGARVEACWPVLRHAFANSMATSFSNDASFGIYLIQNDTDVLFIAGDQPVVNTKVTPESRGSPPAECELYYPISPTRAVVVSDDRGWDSWVASTEKVHRLNQLMVENSHEMVFAKSREQLAG